MSCVGLLHVFYAKIAYHIYIKLNIKLLRTVKSILISFIGSICTNNKSSASDKTALLSILFRVFSV